MGPIYGISFRIHKLSRINGPHNNNNTLLHFADRGVLICNWLVNKSAHDCYIHQHITLHSLIESYWWKQCEVVSWVNQKKKKKYRWCQQHFKHWAVIEARNCFDIYIYTFHWCWQPLFMSPIKVALPFSQRGRAWTISGTNVKCCLCQMFSNETIETLLYFNWLVSSFQYSPLMVVCLCALNFIRFRHFWTFQDNFELIATHVNVNKKNKKSRNPVAVFI